MTFGEARRKASVCSRASAPVAPYDETLATAKGIAVGIGISAVFWLGLAFALLA